MGQIYRKIDSVYLEKAQAQQRIATLENIKNDREAISYAIAQRIVVSDLQSDEPLKQPRRIYFCTQNNFID